MGQIIRCNNYLHTANTVLPVQQPHFLYLPFPALFHSCIQVASNSLRVSQMSNPRKTDNGNPSMVSVAGLCWEAEMGSRLWDHLRNTISVSPSKAAPSFSGGHLKSLSLKCEPQQQ